ncbi:hypothetical protein ACHAW6_005095 [Cyclotella cf. meneghiniana]
MVTTGTKHKLQYASQPSHIHGSIGRASGHQISMNSTTSHASLVVCS